VSDLSPFRALVSDLSPFRALVSDLSNHFVLIYFTIISIIEECTAKYVGIIPRGNGTWIDIKKHIV
jgi:hypothetical protein